MISATFIALIPFLTAASAVNDWSIPCTSGTCEYTLPSSGFTDVSSSGSIKIWGAESAISDITPAAGWEVLDCSADALAQEIRLVCIDESGLCQHLYDYNGAEDKIVRLPESCLGTAFARVSRAWVPKDQSLPSDLARRVVRRDGSHPEVKALALDTDFSAIDGTKTGSVHFAIQGANVPGLDSQMDTTSLMTRSHLADRGLFDFITDIIDKIKSLTQFDVDTSTSLPPIDVDQKFNLFNESISCGPAAASISVDVAAKAHAVVAIGLAAAGTIVPPNIDHLGVTASLSADLDGSIGVVADVSGRISTGEINLFEVGIPGLSFPGILTIGPSFQINAEASAELDVNVDVTVGVNYQINKAQFTFPPNDDAGGVFSIGDTPLKLRVTPGIKARGIVEAHLIPKLNLGISALGNIAQANIFLELDAGAGLILTLEGQADVGVTLPGSADLNRRSPLSLDTSRYTPAGKTKLSDVVAVRAAESEAAETSVETTSNELAVSTEASGTFGGCVELFAGFDVNVGADASFFGVIKVGDQISLFSRDFELFKKCFDVASATTPARRSLLESRQLLDLICPAENVGDAVSLTDMIVSAIGL